MRDGHFATVRVVPLHGVLDDLGAKLVLQVERNLESLRVAVLIDLSHLGASSHIDVLDLVSDDQIWEVHVDLRHNLLGLEIVDSEPELLSHEVAVSVLERLREYQWSLSAVVVFEFDSFVDNSPCLVLSNDFTFLVGRNSSLDREGEQLDARLARTHHLIRIGIENLHTGHSWKQVLAIAGQNPLIAHEQVLLCANLKERFAGFRLPFATRNQSQLRHLRRAHLANFVTQRFS